MLQCTLYSASFIAAAADRGGWDDTAGPNRGRYEKREARRDSSAFSDKQRGGRDPANLGKADHAVELSHSGPICQASQTL